MISDLASKVILTPYHHSGAGSNGTITRVVVHGTVSPCVRGGAENNAYYFQSKTAGGAAHYVVDPGEIVCAVDEDQKAAHAPPNAGSIGVELCDPQAGDPRRWDDDDHRAMLTLAASLVHDICVRHDLPLVWLTPGDLVQGKRGITGHVQVAQAFHQSDHTDPRDMPVDVFMALVAPKSQEDDGMFIIEFTDWPKSLWLVAGTTRKHIPNPEFFYALASQGIKVVNGPKDGGTFYTEVN